MRVLGRNYYSQIFELRQKCVHDNCINEYIMHRAVLVQLKTINWIQFLQDDIRALIQEVTAPLQGTIDDKCEIIARQQTALEQLNDTLQTFIEMQQMRNDMLVDPSTLINLIDRFPRKCVFTTHNCIKL